MAAQEVIKINWHTERYRIVLWLQNGYKKSETIEKIRLF